MLSRSDKTHVVPRNETAMLCPAGFEHIVARVASRDLLGFQAGEVSSGFVRAQTDATVAQLRAFPCSTNTFLVLNECARTSVDRELSELHSAVKRSGRLTQLPRRGSLRVRIHDDGQFASTNTDAAIALENEVAKRSGLVISRSAALVEVWVVRRTQRSRTMLGVRLATSTRTTPARGVLKPEICSTLARVERLVDLDVLDPFAGSGALGDAAAAAGARSVWLSDLAARPAHAAKSQATRWTRSDFRELEIGAGTIGAILTDPPWGHFAEIEDGVESLYGDFGALASKWLKPDGFVVMLTAADSAAIERMSEGGLSMSLSQPVLVSGHKARVLVLRRS